MRTKRRKHVSLSTKLTRAVYLRDRWKCRYCGSRNSLHPHHVIFKSQGGTDTMDNLLTLCASCHMGGIHARKLEIVILKLLPDDLIVQFIPKKGWQP